MDSEESKHDFDDVEKRDTTCRGDDSEKEFFGDGNQPRAICEQQNDKCTEGQTDGLNRDSRKTNFEHRRNAAEHETFEKRVNRSRDSGPLLLENRDHRNDQSADAAEEREWHHGLLRVRMQEKIPGPGRSGDGADQQHARLVDGALQRHCLAEDGAFTLKGALVEGRIRSSHQICHGLSPSRGIGLKRENAVFVAIRKSLSRFFARTWPFFCESTVAIRNLGEL